MGAVTNIQSNLYWCKLFCWIYRDIHHP